MTDDDIRSVSTADLMTREQSCRETLENLFEALENRGDMLAMVFELMSVDDMLETFAGFGVQDPDTAQLVLQAAVASLVNGRGLRLVGRELERRAEQN